MDNQLLNNKEIKSIKQMINSKSDSCCFVFNPVLGRTVLPYGTFGDITSKDRPRGGYGFEHIIQKRFEVDKLNADELTALIFAVLEIVKTEAPKYWGRDRYVIDKSGLKVAIQKNIFNQDNTWIITSYPEIDKQLKIKKEAKDSLVSVIERYGYTPKFSDIRTQVVALTTSIINIRQALDKIKKEQHLLTIKTNK